MLKLQGRSILLGFLFFWLQGRSMYLAPLWSLILKWWGPHGNPECCCFTLVQGRSMCLGACPRELTFPCLSFRAGLCILLLLYECKLQVPINPLVFDVLKLSGSRITTCDHKNPQVPCHTTGLDIILWLLNDTTSAPPLQNTIRRVFSLYFGNFTI